MTFWDIKNQLNFLSYHLPDIFYSLTQGNHSVEKPEFIPVAIEHIMWHLPFGQTLGYIMTPLSLLQKDEEHRISYY